MALVLVSWTEQWCSHNRDYEHFFPLGSTRLHGSPSQKSICFNRLTRPIKPTLTNDLVSSSPWSAFVAVWATLRLCGVGRTQQLGASRRCDSTPVYCDLCYLSDVRSVLWYQRLVSTLQLDGTWKHKAWIICIASFKRTRNNISVVEVSV
jgi:hypothetical protein